MKTKLVRPVLVESKEVTGIWKRKNQLFYSGYSSPIDRAIPQQLILISLEDEKIEVGDEYIAIYSDKSTRKGICKKISEKSNKSEDWNEFKTKEGLNVYYKIIATQSQLSPEYIQQFFEEHNKGEVKDVKIEMETTVKKDGIQELMKDEFYQEFPEELPNCIFIEIPKLTNGYVTIVTKEVPTYTEDEMYRTLHNLMTDIKLKGVAINDDVDLKEWFNQHKKK